MRGSFEVALYPAAIACQLVKETLGYVSMSAMEKAKEVLCKASLCKMLSIRGVIRVNPSVGTGGRSGTAHLAAHNGATHNIGPVSASFLPHLRRDFETVA